MIKLLEGQELVLSNMTTWYKDKEEDKYISILEGYAGTGKTFLTKYFIEKLNISKVLVAAPTNKAKTVIEEMTGYVGMTIHQILGLKLDLDLKDFNPLNPQFNPKGDRPYMNYDLIVIDEASMINKFLYEELVALSNKKKIKILFMGDRYQLPPVKESVSKVFTDPFYKFKLTEIIRQGDDNPNSELIQIAINDIINKTDKLDSFIIERSQDITPLLIEGEIDNFKGFSYLPKHNTPISDYFYHLKNHFLKNNTKYLAFTNNNIEETLNRFRKKILKRDTYIDENDTFLGYKTINIKKGKLSSLKITNSEEYKITDIYRKTLQDGMEGFSVGLKNMYTDKVSYVDIVDLSDEYTKNIYVNTISMLLNNAKQFGKDNWRKYYAFVDNNLSIETVYENGKTLKKKDLDFSYGYTVHKSQGSTYDNTFINLSNINSHFKKEEVRRLKYVAISRCRHFNFFM